ncbi:hypothetical protein J5Y17_11270 [Celeribacter sp. PS-C1]|nr:hypothetical protein [Celeribacter sp. PS-C1]
MRSPALNAVHWRTRRKCVSAFLCDHGTTIDEEEGLNRYLAGLDSRLIQGIEESSFDIM